jgi:CheY-like chemotaxis protein
MRIVVLEDNKERQACFKRGLIGYTALITDTARDCIKALQNEDWDAVFLDHDLYQQAYVPSGPGTGYEVAEWLSLNRNRMPARVYVHSFNDNGRAKMLGVLPEAVAVPGVWVRLREFLEKGDAPPEEVPGMKMQGKLWIPSAL